MNYQRIYDQFISDRMSKCFSGLDYFERHHILPRSLGGTDDPSNIIKLSASDHFFAHLLLSKIYGGKMYYALSVMCQIDSISARGFIPNRWAYEHAKKKMAEQKRKDMLGKGNHFFGKAHSSESIKKISENRKGKGSGLNHHSFGKISKLAGVPMKEETKRKLSEQRMGINNPMYGRRGDKATNYNRSVFIFKNKNTGEQFIGTQRDLINSFSLEFRNVSAVIKGRRKTCCGWQLAGEIV